MNPFEVRVGRPATTCTFIVLSLALACGDPPAEATDLPIVFAASTTDRIDDHELLVRSEDGLQVRKLLVRDGGEFDPAWSPSGDRIAFTGLFPQQLVPPRIFVVDTSGARPAAITPANEASRAPAWSPDGLRIAYVVTDTNPTMRLALVRTDGSAPVRLPNTDDASASAPSWSPDGRRLAFSRRQHGSFTIWLVNADGSGPVELTQGECDDHDPAWSPDGRWIAFRRCGSRGGIHIVRPAGGDLRRLTDYEDDLDPAWAPDGKRILFARSTDTEAGPRVELYTVHVETFALTRLGETTLDEEGADWRPPRSAGSR